MSTKLTVKQSNDWIVFINQDINFMGYTNNIPEIWGVVSKLNWYVNEKELAEKRKCYIYAGSNKYGTYTKLHQIIMILMYSLEDLKLSYSKGFIVEHHDNKAANCSIENLSFAHNNYNLTKAHSI